MANLHAINNFCHVTTQITKNLTARCTYAHKPIKPVRFAQLEEGGKKSYFLTNHFRCMKTKDLLNRSKARNLHTPLTFH